MAQIIEESLLQIIKKDDIKAFDALMENARCGAYRLGRFPVLSLLYLYNSRKILSAYEDKFLRIPNYEVLREPVEISKKFSIKAGKCLRLYFNEMVSPLEMLLILDKTERLKRVFPSVRPSTAVKERLKSVYAIKYSLKVEFVGDNIVIERRPLSYREKRNILAVCLSSVLVVSVTVGVPVTVNAFKIDFSSQKEYTLNRDIVVSKPLKEFNCKIIGNGHKITVEKGATLGELNGKISDLTIESAGKSLFTTVSENAVIKNITVKASTNFTAEKATALVAETNYGTIDGVTVNVSGSISALGAEGADFTFGGIVQTNAFKSQQVYGVIKNCTVNYSQFTLTGELTADASFGGVSGINNGYVQDCTVTGEIKADTFDIAGVCAVNNGVLLNDVNRASLSQTSANAGWNPIVGGIALTNNSDVMNCVNEGDISATSTCVQPEEGKQLPTVSAAGIVYINNGIIGACVNGGSVAAEGTGAAYAGGIAAQSYSRITTCLSNGDITVTAKNIRTGGILGSSEIAKVDTGYGITYYFGITDNCISESKITATGDTAARVGGIVGSISQEVVNSNDSVIYVGGCVTSCYFTGECEEVSYFGNIVGVCGENVYKSNLNPAGNPEHYFDGNRYLNNNSSAFGAILKDGEYVSAVDKGATPVTPEEIKDLKGYNDILSALESLLSKTAR